MPRQEGYLWIPVAVERFDPSSTDPLVKMCQVGCCFAAIQDSGGHIEILCSLGTGDTEDGIHKATFKTAI